MTCSEHVLGRHKNCTNCGAPRRPECPEWMPDDISSSAAVRDPGLLSKFRLGPDWKCRYCDSSQYKADGTCGRCGASQSEGTPDPTVTSKPAASSLGARPRPRKDVVQIPSPAQSVYRNNSPPTILDEPEFVPPKSRPWDNPKFVRYGVGGVLALGLALLAYFLFSTHEVTARVDSVAWTRTVAVQRYQINRHEGWTPDRDAITVQNLGSRVHHYDHVAVGSHREPYIDTYSCGQDCRTVPGSCYTTSRSCTSNRNGSATCSGGDTVCSSSQQECSTRYCTRTLYRTVTDYEDQPRYRDWYAWNVWEWTHNRNLVARGTTITVHTPTEATAPVLSFGQSERLLPPSTEYEVHLSNGKEQVDYKPTDEKEFLLFGPDSQHTLRTGILRSTELIR